MSRTILLDAPNVGVLEKKYLSAAIDSTYISTIGPLVPKFEEKFARFLGAKGAVSTQSGTAAIHVALHELGIASGDEVIVPALTFAASVNPVIYVGVKPVFVDVDPKTWNMDPLAVEKKITKRTKAILAVHLYGNPCDMGKIMAIARRHKLFVIEDATESLGAAYRGRLTGTIGDLGCFSFNGNKIITTGGGGMVIGKDQARLAHIKFLVNQARDGMRGYYHPEVGFNYRMTNLEAAVGLAQMKRLEKFLRVKKEFYQIYRNELKGVSDVRFQKEYPHARSSWWLTALVLDSAVPVEPIVKKLNAKGIQARRIFMPVVEFPYLGRFNAREFKNSYRIYDRGLCLPGSTLNTKDDILTVCRTLKGAL